MKMSKIVEELERQGIEVTYENIAIFAVFVSEEGLAKRLELGNDVSDANGSEKLLWLKTFFTK